jgi:hypothetical protein
LKDLIFQLKNIQFRILSNLLELDRGLFHLPEAAQTSLEDQDLFLLCRGCSESALEESLTPAKDSVQRDGWGFDVYFYCLGRS